MVAWDGTQFRAEVDDRRPLLTGRDAVITPVEFRLKGSEVSASVSVAALGNPTRFGFRMVTNFWKSQPGTEGVQFADVLPDANLTFVGWPS